MTSNAEPTYFDPNIGLKLDELQLTIDNYHQWLDERTEDLYQIADSARSKGLDHQQFVEIPRASDLAGRTEKLLINHLNGMKIADDIREMLLDSDRETTAIQMAQLISKRCRVEGHSLQISIDVGLRVGLAILTEAVLVAPLEGISEVRLLSNIDGSQFVSVHFAGPIRAAGGTAQALAVLIADMIRRELGVGAYHPTQPEIERVKEEFALYRGNLQYRPSPEEIQEIVKACPIMINGESTETIECAGFGRVRNIDEPRVRGGVLLVIGEGMCLKAPKIQRHTERMEVPGWDFITTFANRNKIEENKDKDAFVSRKVPHITKFMKDIIAGRPVFGNPSAPGGFRLRYGRARPSGLAAASCNAASMCVMDDFLAVGTQMKIERPGKACAVTPCDLAEGPWVILDDGSFCRFDREKDVRKIRSKIRSIWDNGEIIIGYGEFLENNKNLVPSAYNVDWWASDLLETLCDTKSVTDFLNIMDMSAAEFPTIPPSFQPNALHKAEDCFYAKRDWFNALRILKPSWEECKLLAQRFGCSIPPPHNPWWKDFPIEWFNAFSEALGKAEIEENKYSLNEDLEKMPQPEKLQLRFTGEVSNWDAKKLEELLPEYETNLRQEETPGNNYKIPESIFPENDTNRWILRLHGLVKASALILGLAHRHEGDDLIITSGWKGMIEGFGYVCDGKNLKRVTSTKEIVTSKIKSLKNAQIVLEEENKRCEILAEKRSEAKIAAETRARQQGLGIAETDAIGRQATDSVLDPGPLNKQEFLKSQKLKDDYLVDGVILLVKKISDLRWEHAAPSRIGARMGRPEKAAPREKTIVHSLFPIELHGGNQRLLKNAIAKREIRVEMGHRTCSQCGRRTPLIRCHHPRRGAQDTHEIERVCGGRTEIEISSGSGSRKKRRQGELQTINLERLSENARVNLGVDRIPVGLKCSKKLLSQKQTPEALEKGILRAKFNLPVFRDGTIRFDMSDVPLTHFTPDEIGVDWVTLSKLGYSDDCYGNKLQSNTQMLEILPQDFIVSKRAVDYLIRTTQFIDELLVRFYGMEAYYHVNEPRDLVGHMIVALAPHTSGGVLSRIIGWSNSSGGYAHPMFHAAKRRNCDGDEDAIMLLLDGLLNFSREILPANRGGQMDAPLVLTTRLNPTEVDKEALNVDSGWFYPRAFYEATLSQPHPNEVKHLIDFVERRLGHISAIRGYGFTHNTSRIDEGPELSAYKTLESMIDKMNGQLKLGHRLRSVDVRNVASSVIRSHFLPDLRGNLVAFTKQKVRCLSCGHSYRRMPLAQKCIQSKSGGRQGPFGDSENQTCNGNLALTVTEGAVRKYIQVTRHVMDTYGVDNYTLQNVEWLAESVESLFNNDKAKQLSITDFL